MHRAATGPLDRVSQLLASTAASGTCDLSHFGHRTPGRPFIRTFFLFPSRGAAIFVTLDNMMLSIALRGDTTRFPGNTLPALRSALRAGSDLVKVDVHLSADGYPVLADERVITTNGSPPRAVSDLTLAELATVRTDIEHRVPTLMEVLAEFPARDVPALLVAADTPEAVLATDTLLRERGLADRLLFTGPVEVLNALRGRSTRAHLLLPWEEPGPPPDDLTHTLRPTFLGTHHTLLNRELVEDLQHRGFRVAAWAVNEYSEMARLAGMGVDAAATDRPAELASLAHGREQGDLMAPGPA